MSKKKRKVPINLSLDEDEYEDYRIGLRGTRFDKNGQVNASAAIRSYIHSVNQETKKSIALGQSVQDRSAIKQLGTGENTKQATLDKVCPDWILEYRDKERRDKTLEGLGVEDLTTLGIGCRNTGTAIMSTLPKLKVSQNDKDDLKKRRLDLENIQTRAMDTTEEEDLEEPVEEEIILE